MKDLVSLQALAWSIRVPLDELKRIADEAQDNWRNHYDHFTKQTGPSKVRHLYPPKPRLKDIHRRLNRYVLFHLDFGPYAHGSISGRSNETNAKQHLGKSKLVTNDIKSFFPSVTHRMVFRMLRNDHGFGDDVSNLITRLTTIEGRLPEGAPTSSTLANLVLAKSLDTALQSELESRKLTYTRYVDDMAFSGDNPLPMLTITAKLLSKSGLQVHRTQSRAARTLGVASGTGKKPNKLKISLRSQPQQVTGMVVNQPSSVGLPRKYRKDLRTAIHALSTVDGQAQSLASIASKIARVQKFHPGEGQRLRKYLDKVVASTTL